MEDHASFIKSESEGVYVKNFQDTASIDKNEKKMCHICSFKISCIDLETHFLDCLSKSGLKNANGTSISIIKEKLYQCGDCSKSFTNISQLKRHKTLIHRPKIFKCNICDKSFTTFDHLEKHTERIHTEHISHNCNICGKIFEHETDLKVPLNVYI